MKEALKKKLMQEGYTVINEYDDDPNEFYPEHNHPVDACIAVIKGSMTVTANKKTVILKPGDKIALPARTIHSAKVGAEGCVYFDAEK